MNKQPYWQTKISSPQDTDVLIRGYSLTEMIGYINFTSATYLLIRGEMPSPQAERVLDAGLSAILDYGLEKSGTVAARFTVSANPSMPAGMAAACLAVGENTVATEYTGRFIEQITQDFKASELPLEEYAQGVVARLRQERRRIPGIGHPVFKKVDPRAQKLRAVIVEEGLWGEAGRVYEAVHQAFTNLPGKGDIPINDVGMLAVLLASLGFTPEEGTGLAILSTMPGVIGHVSEEMRAGKPIRAIPREDVEYDVVPRDFEAATESVASVSRGHAG